MDFSEENLFVANGDEDWFTFTLATTTQVTSTFTYPNGGSVSLNVFDQADNYVYGFDSGTSSPILAAGTYYVGISGYSPIKYGWSIAIK